MNKIGEKDRRKFIRLKVYHLAKYKVLSAKEPHAAYAIAGIRDIGAGGICLMTKEPIPVASVIELQIKFPKLETPIFTVAKVVWIKQLKKHKLYETGAQFMEIEESTRKIIDEQAKFVEESVEKEKTSLLSRLFSRGKK
jgi:c-di-GMP-binding flagellar brake protein YcgR